MYFRRKSTIDQMAGWFFAFSSTARARVDDRVARMNDIASPGSRGRMASQ